MKINQQPSPEQQKLALLRRISDSLQSIASNISHEMGPFKVQPIVSMSDEMAEQWEKNEESNRRDTEILELKRANKIAYITTAIAVAGLLLTAIIGALQLRLDWVRYQDEQKKTDQVEITKEVNNPSEQLVPKDKNE